MPFSYNDVGPKARGDSISVPFPYLAKSHVSVLVDGEVVSGSLWAWASSNTLTCLEGFPAGTVTRVRRNTPIDTLPAEQQGVGVFDFLGANKNDLANLYYIQERADFEEFYTMVLSTTLVAGKVIMVAKDGKSLEMGPTAEEVSAAQGYAESAAQDREAAEAAAASVAGFGLRFTTVAALKADTFRTPVNTPVGTDIEAGGHRYKVVASGEDWTTDGGLKLSYQKEGDTVIPDAWPIDITGGTDDSVLIQAATDKAAGGFLKFLPDSVYSFKNIQIKDSVRIDLAGRIECRFNDDVNGSTSTLFYTAEADAIPRVAVVCAPGLVIDGNYDITVTVVDECSLFDFRGCGWAYVANPYFLECATGAASLPTVVLDRSHSLIRYHKCGWAILDHGKARRCRKFEEIWVSECDNYLIRGFDSDGIDTTAGTTTGPFSGVSVLNCGPGIVEGCTIKNRTVSGFNILSRFATVRNNTGYYFRNAAGTGGSYGIDCTEGLFYAHGTVLEGNIIDECYRAGISIIGNGAQARRNKTTNCLYGLYVTNILDPIATVYGGWLSSAEESIKGMVLEGNHSSDHNGQNAGTNAGGFINSATGFPISATISSPTQVYNATATEYAWYLHGCGTIKMQGGHLSDARSALVYTTGTWTGDLIFDGMEWEYDSDGTVHGLLYAATHKDIIFRNHLFNGTLGASMHDIVWSSPGTVNAIRLDGSTRAIDDAGAARSISFSVPTNTRRLKNGRIQQTIALTSVNVPANWRQDRTGVALEGLRAGDQVEVTVINTVWDQIVHAGNAYYTADNVFRFALFNGTPYGDTADKSVLVVATEAGYQL